MSLFKVVDFWNLDLEQLISHFSFANQEEGLKSNLDDDETNFCENHGSEYIVSIGNFKQQIGDHDVLVCASLRGFVCIVQIPKEVQDKFSFEDKKQESSSHDKPDRQLLLAQQLPFPIVDIKCGHFTSSVRQSLAILSFNKLMIYHLKKHQMDLLTSDLNQSSDKFDSLFSHELEEQHRFELIPSDLATRIIPISNHQDDLSNSTPDRGSANSAGDKFNKSSAKLQLPQRDSIIVQYSNQLIFTIIENKKLIAHYELTHSGVDHKNEDLSEISESTSQDQDFTMGNNVEQLNQFVGNMPMTYLHDSKGSSLIISLSSYVIYSISLEKLLSFAKHNVMKRVAQNLLNQHRGHHDLPAGDKSFIEPTRIGVDPEQTSNWSRDLVSLPLDIKEIRRKPISHSNQSISSQILVLSRYNLDLFSSSAEHIWSLRFETPLITAFSYLTIGDKLITLVCTDLVGVGRSNLVVLQENLITWSASLNCKPNQMFKNDLSSIKGILVTLDGNQLCASYFGTNREIRDDLTDKELDGEQLSGDMNFISLTHLDFLDEPLFPEHGKSSDDSTNDIQDLCLGKDKFLIIDVRLEASDEWPDVKVACSIKLSLCEQSDVSGRVLHDLKLIVEFDELLAVNILNFIDSSEFVSPGVCQLNLGNLWPDRRDQIKVELVFYVPNRATNESELLLPKTLKVRLYSKFNEYKYGLLVQEDSFMLPLNLVTKLIHIDYSSGSDQTLEDVQNNLNLSKRLASAKQYYLCDLILKTQHGELIELVDEILESDIICRGFNSESSGYSTKFKSGNDRKQSILENLNLLAQSQDCRLKFKSLNSRTHTVVRQSSEDDAPVVMVSFALEMSKGFNVSDRDDNVDSNVKDDVTQYTIVWLHLIDLQASDSAIPGQIIREHMKDWKIFETESQIEKSLEQPHRSIMISIECDCATPVLYMQNHLHNRFEKRLLMKNESLAQLSESISDAIDIDYKSINLQPNLIAMNESLYSFVTKLREFYKVNIELEFEELQKKLANEYDKFQSTTMALMSLSKRLFNLPDNVQTRYTNLTLLIKLYQSNLLRLLNELEKLKLKRYNFSKLPVDDDNILIETDHARFERLWPNYDEINKTW